MAVQEQFDEAPARLRGVTPEEWALRVRLAAAYRVVEHLGWTESIYGHLTARVPGLDAHFLINPYGLRYDEVTASNLVKIDLEGNPVGPVAHPINRAGFIIHAAVHRARPDLHCVFHTHTTAGMAVAAQAAGLLPISIMASLFWNRVAYHDWEGPTMRMDEQERLVASLGARKVMILRNHGLLTGGASVEEAFLLLFRLQRACEIQVAALAGGTPLAMPADEVAEQAARSADDFIASSNTPPGLLEFDALVRRIDALDPGYRH